MQHSCMQDSSRKWFNQVYEKMRESSLPFCAFNEPLSEDDSKFILRNSNKKSIKKLCLLSDFFSRQKPSTEDFIEEKGRVLEELVPELQERIPYANSTITFGKIIGDIDIGLISSKLNDKELFNLLQPGVEMFKKYPLVDWDSLFYFISNNGYQLGLKILESRLRMNGYQKLDDSERQYFDNTLKNARLLFGDKRELILMKSVGDKLKIN